MTMDIFIPLISGATLCLLPSSTLEINAKPAWVLLGLWHGYSLHRLSASSHLPVAIYATFCILDFYLTNSVAKTLTVILWMVLGVVAAETFNPFTLRAPGPDRSRRVYSVRLRRMMPSETFQTPTERPTGRQITFAETHRTMEFVSENSAISSLSSNLSSPLSNEHTFETPAGTVSALPQVQTRVRGSCRIPGGYTSQTPQYSSDPNSHLPSPPTTFTLQSPEDSRPSAFRPLSLSPPNNLPVSHNSNGLSVSAPPPISIDDPSSSSSSSNNLRSHAMLSLLSPLDMTPDPSAPDGSEEVKIVPPPANMAVVTQANDSELDIVDMEATAERLRQAAKTAHRQYLQLKPAYAAARDAKELKASIALKVQMSKIERDASNDHESADDLFYILDNPSKNPNRVDVHRMTPHGAVKLMNEALSRFLAEGGASLEFVVGSTLHGRAVKAALMEQLKHHHIPFTDHDSGVLVITKIQ